MKYHFKKPEIKFEKQFLFIYILIILLVSFGASLAVKANYGADNDTYGMLFTFDSLISGNGYSPSRFTGYPVAELLIGAVSFQFGSWLANLGSFSLICIAFIFLYKSLNKDNFDFRFALFFALCVTNPVLFFDNLAPMDYSIAIFFFSLGLFFLKKNDQLFSILFFGISIGSRPNFLFFCLAAIFFLKSSTVSSAWRKLYLASATIFIGSLFYFPIWFESGLGVSWITAVQPLNQGYVGIISRFIYKTWMAVGLIVFPLVLYLLKTNFSKLRKIEDLNFIFIFITVNLVIYLSIPADRSYLQPALIFLCFLVSFLSVKNILFILTLNLISWVILIMPFNFTFKSNNPCDPIEVIGARLSPHLEAGEYFIYMSGQNKSVCFQDYVKNRSKELISGLPLN